MFEDLLFAKKRLDRWWRFNALKDAFITSQQATMNSKREVRVLDRAFRRIGYGPAPESVRPFWCELVSHGAARKSVLQAGDEKKIELLADNLDSETLPAKCWFDLYRLCIGVGFFQVGRILRDRGLGRMVSDAGQGGAVSSETLALGIYAELEKGNFTSAESLLNKLGGLRGNEQRALQAHWFLQLLEGSSERDTYGFSGSATSVDLEFGNFIKGKRVALVGPVPSDKAQGHEIDGHDVVVKFGYRGGQKGRDPETQGERLDISYYNNTQAQQLAQSDYEAVFSSIRWAVCHNRKGRSLFPADYPGVRQLTSFQWLLADTHFNAGPNAIIDLLRFLPAGICVFNTDLMLSSGRFAGYTPAGAKPVDYTRSFIKTHDPILQYQVMHQLWKVGYLSGDVRFNAVMGMGLRRYLDELQKAHGAREQALI
ncbi:hypothetical protein MARLIPOL_17873 [Marinobacter lipolyticus SM19]|uniref:Uncharacterized protein n=1 Tax=Marinobacter lipolyticus SM19 TaxID=1318628 RepID=R8AWD3_9GAMM|nr:hypothetical protein [Marinobacter lipolyticus]EON90640.1 hypothetical protein MARLIPOL_17873 [Marinobacter lipolyticus SM19]